MRLTKLELIGFKSFADATDLVFEQGVTAIVGPNGCGKSNVSDAVRWVLGEQRARLLRGAKMEEVIFQGSSARRPVNVAEVSLHFSNDEGILPVPFKEVVITRRLSRSGESEYFLNRAPCRLRDIHDLVRGTGLGADSGVVIESKMIDALLSDRPDERRELFEEAAGVGLYRDRRRSTERRLEETSLDLQRLDDLITEVQSQVRSLARQRKRAERAQELTQRRFGVELTLASREMAAWADELARMERTVADLKAQAPQAEQGVREAEAARDAAHGARAAAEAGRGEWARLVAEQRAQVATLQGEIAVTEERQRNAAERRQRADVERQEREAAGQLVQQDKAQAEGERADAEAALAGAREVLTERTGGEDAARAALARSRAAVDLAERALRQLDDQRRQLEAARDGAERERGELAERLAGLETEQVTLADALASAQREQAMAADGLATAQTALAAAAAERDAAAGTLKGARERDAVARAELARAEEASAQVTAKAHALAALERDRVGLAPGAQQLLMVRERFGDGAVLGPVTDFVTAAPDAAALVERFLGNTMHAVVVRDRAVADAVRAWHAEARPGPLLLLPLDAAAEVSDEDGSLAGQVSIAETIRAWGRALLGRVRALDGGRAFVDARGAVWLPGETAGPGPLQRRAELTALQEAAASAAAARDAAAAMAALEREAVLAAEGHLRQASDAWEAAQLEARRAEGRRLEAERDVQRAQRVVQEAAQTAARLRQRDTDLAQTVATKSAEAEALVVSSGERTLALEEARGAVAAAEQAQDAAREARTQAQVAEAQADARLQVARDRARRLSQEAEATIARLAQLSLELDSLHQNDGALGLQLESWRADLAVRRESLASAEARLAEAELAVQQADAAVTAADHALDAARRGAGQASEALFHAELRHTELSGRRAAIRERLETEWRKPMEDLFAGFEPLASEDAELKAEAEQLRGQLEQLGPVNPLAIEEHEEEVKRLDFLTRQRDDLHAARQSLTQAIREIDATAKELFLATFVQVREHFRQIFMTLFGGGECDLRLEKPETPLEGDIEVHASPRGKKTQRIHLLSSGERALVALSLLFGIFLTKPSPFCLLDEVDAPLDDQNIGRFVRMLNQFKSNTQFIVITHNPRTTTEAADAAYGETMQEPGVSSVVSVRLRGNAVEEAIAGKVAVGA
ncbi:MAG: chromosome segregation protein SMC [Gemmatimonadota bacterium]